MSNRKIRGRTVASAAVVAAAVGVAGFAFTAANTVPNTKAGDGAGTITGFVASSVHYTLNSTNPRNMDSVSFTLDSTPIAGSTIRAQVVDGGTWYACTNTLADVTCDTTVGTQATVVSTNQLRVVVAQ